MPPFPCVCQSLGMFLVSIRWGSMWLAFPRPVGSIDRILNFLKNCFFKQVFSLCRWAQLSTHRGGDLTPLLDFILSENFWFNQRATGESSKHFQTLETHFLAEFKRKVWIPSIFKTTLRSCKDTATNLLRSEREFMSGFLQSCFEKTKSIN